jgi:hypothetical protein
MALLLSHHVRLAISSIHSKTLISSPFLASPIPTSHPNLCWCQQSHSRCHQNTTPDFRSQCVSFSSSFTLLSPSKKPLYDVLRGRTRPQLNCPLSLSPPRSAADMCAKLRSQIHCTPHPLLTRFSMQCASKASLRPQALHSPAAAAPRTPTVQGATR